jgi:hypothetical protein
MRNAAVQSINLAPRETAHTASGTAGHALAGARRQRGIGALGFIFVLLVIGGAAALTIKLVPHYLSFYSIVDALQKLDSRTLAKPKFKMYDDIEDKVLKINNIHDTEPQSLMEIEKVRGRIIFHVDYRVEEPIVQNIGVYVHFKRDVVRNL